MHAVRRGCVMPARTSMTRHTTVDYVLVTSLMLSMSCLQPRPTKRTRSPDHLSCSAPRFSSKPLPPSSPGLYALLCMLSNALRNERNEVALPIVGLGRSRGSDGARDGERLSSMNRARCRRSGCANHGGSRCEESTGRTARACFEECRVAHQGPGPANICIYRTRNMASPAGLH